MKALIGPTLLIILAMVVACGGGGGGDGGSDEAQITERTQQAFAAIRNEDWNELLTLVSPGAGCDEGEVTDFFSSIADLAGADPSKSGIRDVRVTVQPDGQTAVANYMLTYDGQDRSRSSDSWVKEDGRWYLAFLTVCGGSAVADVASPTHGSSPTSATEAGIRERFEEWWDAWNTQDWEALYALASARSKNACGYDDFAAGLTNLTGSDILYSPSSGFTDLVIEVDGDEAVLNFTQTAGGAPVKPGKHTFVLDRGEWYEDYNGFDACMMGIGGATSDEAIDPCVLVSATDAAGALGEPVRDGEYTPARDGTGFANCWYLAVEPNNHSVQVWLATDTATVESKRQLYQLLIDTDNNGIYELPGLGDVAVNNGPDEVWLVGESVALSVNVSGSQDVDTKQEAIALARAALERLPE